MLEGGRVNMLWFFLFVGFRRLGCSDQLMLHSLVIFVLLIRICGSFLVRSTF
jgi:hypothetical protein